MTLDAYLQTALDAAQAAGGFLRANFGKPLHVDENLAHDIKLELDKRTQALIESIILDRTMVDVWIAAAALMSTYHAGLHGKCTSSYCTPGTHVYELSLPTFVLNLMTTDDH